jgi:mitochondrial fission protein ELM1
MLSTARTRKLMRVLILSDGVPGHDRSSLGILAALKKHRNVEARVLLIFETQRLSRRAKRLLAGLLPFPFFWRTFYRIGDAAGASNPLPPVTAIPSGDVDLVVSTGPRTAAANIAVARKLNAKNVYFGFSRWPSDGFFTVLLTPERRPANRHRAHTLRPSEIDASKLPDPRPLAPNGTERRAAILFGGRSKHYAYTRADMQVLAARLVEIVRDAPWLKWTVFDSRRTTSLEFEELVARIAESGAPVEFVRFAKGGLLSNRAAFHSDLVLVTADSTSMLAESIAARRPTGILFADCYRPPRRDAAEIQAAIADRRAFPITFSRLSTAVLLKEAAAMELLAGSQLDSLYETMRRHGV